MRYGAEVVLYLLLFYSHVSKQEDPAARDSQSDPSFGDQESLKDLLRIVNGDDVGLGYVPFMVRKTIIRWLTGRFGNRYDFRTAMTKLPVSHATFFYYRFVI